ncbi:MAG TPA: DUF2070 family protein [Pyrodictium sp.]|nr:DUF2070 family protein [Pyrodictium sp.]
MKRSINLYVSHWLCTSHCEACGSLEAGLERFYYRFTVGLPKHISVPITIVLLGILLLLWLFDRKIDVLLSCSAYILTLLVLRKCSDAKIANLRRLLWFLAVAVIGSVTAFLFGFDPVKVMSVVSILPLFACLGFSGSPICLLACSAIFPLYLADEIYAMAYLVGLAIVGLGFLSALSVFGRTMKPFHIAVAHVRAWLADDYHLIEDLFSCEKKRTFSHIVAYRFADGSCLSIVVPGVHFGPFRNAGSSRLPYEIEEKCSNSVVVLHGVLDHSYNVSKVEDSKKYAQLIADAISRACKSAKSMHGIKSVMVREERLGELRIMSIPSILPVLIVDRPGLGIDDVVVWSDGVRYPLVDAHNEIVVDWKGLWSAKRLGRDIVKLYANLQTCNNLRMTLVQRHVSESEARRLGLCKPQLKLLYISCDGDEWAYLVVPSNNARSGARERVEKILLSKGVKGTLLTIDDHVCAGLEPGVPTREFTYDESLKDVLKELVEEAKKKAKLVTGVSYEVVEEDVVVWGKCYNQLINYMRRGRIAVATFLTSLIVGIVLGLVWP